MFICCQPGLLIQFIKFQPKAGKFDILRVIVLYRFYWVFELSQYLKEPLLLLLRNLRDQEVPAITGMILPPTDLLTTFQQKREKNTIPGNKEKKENLSHSLSFYIQSALFSRSKHL